LGRFSTLGVYTGILALAAAGAQYIPSPTWGQVFQIALESTANLGSAAASGASAVVSSPLLTLATATAIMKWRARNQPKGAISVAELMKRDARALGGAIQRRLEARASPPATLREIATRLRSQQGPAGQGASEMRAIALSSGAPSAEMGVEDGTVALVPASERDIGEPIRRLSGVFMSPGSVAASIAQQQPAARSGLATSFGSSASVEDEPLIDVPSSAAAATQPSTPVEAETPSNKRRGSKVNRHGGTVSS